MQSAPVNTKRNQGAADLTIGALRSKGYTVARFAREHGFSYGTVQAVIHQRRGLRRRGKSQQIAEAIQRLTA